VNLEATIEEMVRVALRRREYEGSPLDLAVCRHEAAHCLAAWAVRAPALKAVSVDHEGGGEALNNAPRPAGAPDEPRAAILERLRREHPAELAAVIRRQCVTLFAGRAADERGDGYRLGPSSSQSDQDEAAFLAEATVGRAGVDRFLAPLRAAATSIVAGGWPVIEELALLLSYERRLPGAFVEAWISERPVARSLRDRWGAKFASPVSIEKPSSAAVPPDGLSPLLPASSVSAPGELHTARA
jgi:hypothetical protein